MKKKSVLIGCGEWGSRQAKTLFELNELYGVFDINQKKSDFLSKKFKVHQFKTIQEIIKHKKNILSLFICSSAETHYDLFLKMHRHFNNFFIEKPLVNNLNDIKKIENIKKGKKIFIGHLMHFHPAINKIENIIKSGELGTVKSVIMRRHNLGRYRTFENVVQSFAPHDLSIVFRLFGSEYSNLKYQTFFLYQNNHIDYAQIFFNSKKKIKINISVSWTSILKEQKMTIFGTRGILEFEDTEQDFDKKLKIVKIEKFKNNLRKRKEYYLKLQKKMPLRQQAINVIASFNNKIKYLPNNLDESKKILKFIDKIR